ncbi:MAG: M13 family metallopeptidase, partial [Lachnospiraceae bacterium]|nr:M13 family metallopeptidase [Lachnospiraceae bacterium]
RKRMKNVKRFIALILAVALALSDPAAGELSVVEAGRLRTDFAIPSPVLKGTKYRSRIDNGTPWVDSELKENVTKRTPIDPKEDFHLYANKDWLVKNKIPRGYESWSHYAERANEVKRQCMKLLKDPSIFGHDADLIHTLNSLILDWDTRNAIGVTGIKDLADRILAVQNIEELKSLLMSEEGIELLDNFISVGAGTGLTDSSYYQVFVGNSGFLLSDAAEYEKRSEYGDMQYDYAKDVFSHMAGRLGMDPSEAQARFDGAIAFESLLAPSALTSEDEMSDDYIERINNEMFFSEVGLLSGAYPLTEMIEKMGYRYEGKYVVEQPEYLRKLNEVFNDSNLEGMKDLIYVGYVTGFSNLLDEEIVSYAGNAYEEYFGGNGSITDREMAYNMVSGMLPAAMQKVYVSRYGSTKDKRRMEQLCRQVIRTYRELLRENKWASRKTINYAIKKLNSIKIHAAYPDEWMDYSSISLDGKNLVDAVRAINEYYTAYNQSLMGQRVNDRNWASGMNLLSCNAFYSAQDNTINMIIGMMGEPFFSDDMSKEELYASIGAFWVGHEVSHAFDNNGSQFDANGDYKDWWTKKDKQEFNRRVRKMNRYLDKIIPFGKYHVNGSNVNTEMIADMTGLQCALRMAKKERHFDYDKFFKTYAQMNASLSIYSTELYVLTQDEHLLDYLRTNVPVQQFEEFYKTYDVEKGDGMYLAPKDRLLIW